MRLPALSTLNAQQGLSNTPFQHGSQEALEKSPNQAVEGYITLYYDLLNAAVSPVELHLKLSQIVKLTTFKMF